MNEKYGIELEAKVDKFKAVMQSTANYVKNLAKDMKDAMTVAPKSTLYQGMSKEDLKKELEVQKSIMRQAKENMNAKNVDPTSSFFTKSKQAYAEASVRVSFLNNRLKETKDVLENTEKDFDKNDNSIGNVFKQGIANIKRFSFYLLGARSVFTLFMKYQNIYYQYNQQMQYQSELSQNAIALSLAPAFEFLGNVIAYASIGFARFIELLTGVNVLSKVSTKGIRDYNKSLKETQTLIAGVDEITNLTTPNSTGLAGQYQALEDFRKKVDEVIAKFDEWGVGKFANTLKDIYNDIGGINGLLAIMAGFSFSKLIGTASVGGTGLLGVKATLISLTTLPMILTTGGLLGALIREGKDLSNTYKEARLERDKLLGENLKSVNEEKDKIEEYIEKIENLDTSSKTYEKDREKYMTKIKQSYEKMSEILLKDKDLFIDNKDYLFEIANKLDEMGQTDYYTQMTLYVEANTEKADSELEAFWKKHKAKVRSTETILEAQMKDTGFGKSNKRTYAKGLDYVPYDNYPALLHKGEAVVPAKYNPAIHSAGNDYTNSLLETLVVKMDDLASRPNVFEVDGQKFATATYGLYKGQENRQNYNTNVVVR